LLQNGDVGVRVFPECEEILVARPGLAGIPLQNVGLSQTLASHGSKQRVQNDASIVENFLKFESCILPLAAGEVSLAAKVGGPVAIGPTLLVTLDWREQLNGSCGTPALEFDGGQKLGKVNISE
jgi:hypothetical protein